MLPWIRQFLGRKIVGFIAVLLLLSSLGCQESAETKAPAPVTYTLDSATRNLVAQLAQKTGLPAYTNFDRNFRGLFVPPSLLPWEPYVLALATESKIPVIISLDAPWVQRYGTQGWLYELERTQVFPKEEVADLIRPLAEAFSLPLPRVMGPPVKELVAVPTYNKGNILFYRQDLLQRYQFKSPPRTWDELKVMCRKIMAQEQSVKFGLIFHPTNFLNDFLPILWGYNGQVVNANDLLVLQRDRNRAACLAALTDLKNMQGKIVPTPKDLAQLVPTDKDKLPQAFFQGEAIFMINWDTRLHDLKLMIDQEGKKTPGSLTDLNQIGVAPIPCQSGSGHRYSNIGSSGWAINRFAVTNPHVIAEVRKFISLVSDKQFQVQAANQLGRMPARLSALKEVSNKEVLKVYEGVYAQTDVRLKARPFNLKIYNTLEKYFTDVVYGRRSPEDALQSALHDLKSFYAREK